MIIKHNTNSKMAILPMAVFLFGFLGLQIMGAHLPLLSNQALAAIGSSLKHPDHPQRPLSSQSWREQKIFKTSLQYNPDKFYELSAADLRVLFGAPSMIRTEGTSQMLQYSHSGCAIDFYYLSSGSKDIAHYEIRHTDRNVSGDCLKTLIDAL